MDRESKRLTKTRAATLLGIVVVHGLIVIWALSIVSTSAMSTPAIQVLIVDKPPRLRAEEKLSALQMNELKPVLEPIAVPHVDVPAESPPPQALASEQTSDSNVSVVASNGAPWTSTQSIRPAPRILSSQTLQWEMYRVTQKGGTSEWLIDVTRSGIISTAQALVCTPEQTAIGCP